VMQLIYVFSCTAIHLQTSFVNPVKGGGGMSIELTDTSLFLAWKLSRA
jgi:hypothetical protein